MNLVKEINAAYAELTAARWQVHVLEKAVMTFREKAVEENFEDLKGARSIEARNQAIAVLLKDESEYQEAQEDLGLAKLRFDLAKDEIDRMKLLARLEHHE